jgi:hypothetical protein
LTDIEIKIMIRQRFRTVEVDVLSDIRDVCIEAGMDDEAAETKANDMLIEIIGEMY